MKKLLTLITFLTLSSSLFTISAQVTLYGLASSGGDSGAGTLFSVTPTGNITVISPLGMTHAAIPYGSPCYASDGNFYASSVEGGYADSCAIFRCTPTGNLTTMINLDSVWGASMPEGNGLMQAGDGNLYGMTTMGGTNGQGVIYKLALTGQYSEVYFFNGNTDGAEPYGSLIQTADGNLWGMTSMGGTHNGGTIFKCTTSGTYTVMHNFDTLEGVMPYGDLYLASDGNFYGLTSAGGAANYGTLFRFSPSGTFTKLVDFDFGNGASPSGSLIQASDGNLYGLTSQGGIVNESYGLGTLFKCSLSGTLTAVYVFTGNDDGGAPKGTLMEASDHNIYGMCNSGGASSYGTIFQYTLTGTFTKIADFNDSNGANPMYGKLIEPGYVQGVNEVNNASQVALYPNPNNGQFNVSIRNSKSGADSKLEVYNMLGEKVYSQQFSNADSKLSINIGSQAPGIYMYQVLSQTGSIVGTGRFIVE